MKNKILKLLSEGQTDYEFIASSVGCSVRYVYEMAKQFNKLKMNSLPATLSADLALVEELANEFNGKNAFAAGVRWSMKSLMFLSRLLGQLAAIPTMGRVGELTELVTLARAMEPKPAPPDPALMAALNNVSQSLANLAKPKTPEMAMFEVIGPVFGRLLETLMANFGLRMPGQEQEEIPGFTRKTVKRGEVSLGNDAEHKGKGV